MKSILSLTVNGRPRDDLAADNLLLIDYLRETVGLTGTKMGCDGGECGACTVLVDGAPRLSCITLAHGCAGTAQQAICTNNRVGPITKRTIDQNQVLAVRVKSIHIASSSR